MQLHQLLRAAALALRHVAVFLGLGRVCHGRHLLLLLLQPAGDVLGRQRTGTRPAPDVPCNASEKQKHIHLKSMVATSAGRNGQYCTEDDTNRRAITRSSARKRHTRRPGGVLRHCQVDSDRSVRQKRRVPHVRPPIHGRQSGGNEQVVQLIVAGEDSPHGCIAEQRLDLLIRHARHCERAETHLQRWRQPRQQQKTSHEHVNTLHDRFDPTLSAADNRK